MSSYTYRALVITIYLILSPISKAHASESALSASPAILETVLDQKQPTITTVTIQNNTNFPLPIKGSVSAFLSTESIPDKNKDTFNASRWFTLDPADFILQPNEVKKVTVTITPPRDAEPGGHYATISDPWFLKTPLVRAPPSLLLASEYWQWWSLQVRLLRHLP